MIKIVSKTELRRLVLYLPQHIVQLENVFGIPDDKKAVSALILIFGRIIGALFGVSL